MFSSQVRRNTVRRFARWSSAVAKPVSQSSNSGGDSGPWVPAMGAAGTLGLLYAWFRAGSDNQLEAELKEKARNRTASNVVRADPVGMSKEVADYLRFTEPEASPRLVQLGVELCASGYNEEMENREKFDVIKRFKEKNSVMSWADLGAFVAHHALLEMGAPLVNMTPFFGRSDAEAEAVNSKYEPLPGSDATFDDLLNWGKQFNLTPPETAAVLGGQPNGSVLFGGSGDGDMEVSAQYYLNILTADKKGELDSIKYGKAFANDEFGRKCCLVFGGDQLYWNKYFVSGLDKVMNSNWAHLKGLPNRILGSTNNAAWATRQKMVYGVKHEYTGSSTR